VQDLPLAELNAEEGLGYMNGQPYPAKWPKSRKREQRVAGSQRQGLLEAFGWPKLVGEALAAHMDMIPPEDKPIAATKCQLRTSSHWSGICTQSRGAAVLQANKVVNCTFQHVRSLENPC